MSRVFNNRRLSKGAEEDEGDEEEAIMNEENVAKVL
jgi:hypothetical protein